MVRKQTSNLVTNSMRNETRANLACTVQRNYKSVLLLSCSNKCNESSPSYGTRAYIVYVHALPFTNIRAKDVHWEKVCSKQSHLKVSSCSNRCNVSPHSFRTRAHAVHTQEFPQSTGTTNEKLENV